MNRDQHPDDWTFPELLAGYADGELSAPDRGRVESWLAEHPEAAAELETQRRLGRRHNRLWANAGAPQPSDAQWSMMALRVRSAIQMAPKHAAEPAARPIARRRLLVFAATFAAGLLLAVMMLRPTGDASKAPAAVEAFAVASGSDVEIMRIFEADTELIVIGELPLRGMIVLASVEDIEGMAVVKDTDGMMPMIQMQAGPNAPMIVAPMAGK